VYESQRIDLGQALQVDWRPLQGDHGVYPTSTKTSTKPDAVAPVASIARPTAACCR
jgi:hypothetical protein